MDEIGILPQFNDVMCHEHWKRCYRYTCLHLLCNAHHLRESTRTYEQNNQARAEEIQVEGKRGRLKKTQSRNLLEWLQTMKAMYLDP